MAVFSRPWLALMAFLLICFGAAAIGSIFTSSSLRSWYVKLRKPSFNPPNWVFGPVWTSLYFMMALSAWLVWRNADWSRAKTAFLLFFVQLGLNVLWTAVFFGLRRPGAAVIEICLLLVAILATASAFLPFSRVAFWLMMPYAAWVSFATFLNLKIWQMNSGTA